MQAKRDLIKETLDLLRHINSNYNSELTIIQLRTLSYIEENKSVKPSEIAKEFGITPATITSQIDKLEKEGWVEREYDKNDKRVIRVSLTQKGKDGLDEEIDIAISEFEWVFNTLTTNEQTELLRIVKKLHKNAHKSN